ncbi:MAG: hypothetical protein GXO24_02790 [Chlorobi bacterium]|nr:hypothetical protein [Chlorobiota bacterium]
MKKFYFILLFLFAGVMINITSCKKASETKEITSLEQAIKALNDHNMIIIKHGEGYLTFEVREKPVVDNIYLAKEENEHNCYTKDQDEFKDCTTKLLDAGYCLKTYKDGDYYVADVIDCDD